MLQMEYEFPFNEDPIKYYLILSYLIIVSLNVSISVLGGL